MGLLEWGDMYKRTDALGFTSSEDAVYQPPRLASLPSPSYNIREELFETDEDIYFEMVEKDVHVGIVGSVYPTYTPSHQKSSFNLNLPAVGEDDDEEIYFPSYDDVECSDKVECMEPPTESTQTTQRPVSPDPVERSEDDSAIQVQPSRHVDYLSHDWDEEDIWASWKHIVSKRGAYNNSARLENASWRSWAKKRSNLRTVPPETVKWMKDHDLTWLYGPLTPGATSSFGDSYMPNKQGRRLSKAEIARHSKKPILKKRSLSEIMLRRSISSSLLLKQAVVAKIGKNSAQSSILFESPTLTRSNTDITSSTSTSGLGDTSDGWKKVQFHELVEQCIALANAGDEENEYHYCSDSDDDVIVMRKAKKRATSKWLPSIKPKAKTPISKTIEKLPHAPLKDNEALEDVPEEGIPEEISDSESASPSSQVDTSGSTSLDHDSDEEDDMDWRPPAWLQGRKDSVQIVKDRMSDFQMQQEEVAKQTKPRHRPQLERRDATATSEAHHLTVSPAKEGTDASIKFELPPVRSQLSTFSFKTPKYQVPRDDYFMVDPGMTEGESEDSSDMARSASQLSQTSNKSEPPTLALDNFQRVLVDRVMSEFWALFNQQWDTYSQGSALSPLSPTSPNIPLSFRKRRRGGRGQRREKSNYFENIPEDGLASPDSKELADYECYIHRELPRAVQRNIEITVRRDSQPEEAHLVGNLVNIIHDCEDKLFQSYFEETDRVMRSLGILSMDPSQSSTVSKTEHHRSEILDAAFHQSPSQYLSSDRSSVRSSTISSAPQSTSSAPPSTPRDRGVCDSGYASEITSTTSLTPSRRDKDVNKWSLPKDVKGKDGRSIREMDLYDYDAVDEALAWASVY